MDLRLDPTLLAAMRSRFVNDLELNPSQQVIIPRDKDIPVPYEDSIPQEFREENPGTLMGDWEPRTEEELLGPRYHFDRRTPADFYGNIMQPVLRQPPVEGTQITI
jgi:hypothetical protein